MKVLLVNTNTIKPLIAPIGLEYLGEYLKDNGVDVSVADLSFRTGLPDTIKRVNPDFIGIGIRNTDDCSFPSAQFLLEEIKGLAGKIRESTPAPVVFGGVGFSVMPEAVLEYLGQDYGIYGDGEEAFLKFIRSYPDIACVPNLVYRKGKRYVRTARKFFNLEK